MIAGAGFFDKLRPPDVGINYIRGSQPVEKGHRKVAIFSYRRRKCGIMDWGDKNAGKERRKSRTA